MSNYNPKTFTSFGILRTIPPELLYRFFEKHSLFLTALGFTWPDEPAKFDHKALHEALLKPDCPPPEKGLSEAMFVVHEMTDDAGVDALVEALREKDPTFTKDKNLDPVVFVLEQWLADPDLVEETNARRYARENRSFHSFRSQIKLPECMKLSADSLNILQAAFADRLAPFYPKESVKLYQFPEVNNHTIRMLIRHAGPLIREGIVKANDPGESDSFLFRREVFDVVIYDPTANEVRIHAKKRDCDLYTRAIGAHFVSDEDIFPDIDKYTLEPLRTKGEEALACAHILGLRSITLVEIELFYGGEHRESIARRATNIFATKHVKEHGVAKGGQLQSARFQIAFATSKRSRTVTIQTPNKAKFKRDNDGNLVEQWLRSSGFIFEIAPEIVANDMSETANAPKAV